LNHPSPGLVYTALAGNALVAAIKFAAAWFTGSAAMLSEAIRSLVDTIDQGLLLLGLRQAARPPTSSHPFGYGLRLYFWTFVVAVMIFAFGAGASILEGIDKIVAPRPVESANINYIVLGASLVFEGAVWIVALRKFREVKGRRGRFEAVRLSKDPTTFTVLFEDTAAILGILIAFAGIGLSESLELPLLDGVASLIIGLTLALTSALLAYECQSLMTGEGVSPEVRAEIQRLVESEKVVERVNEMLTMHFGPADVLVALSLQFDESISAAEIGAAVTRIEQRIRAAHPEVTRVFIEAQSFEANSQRRVRWSEPPPWERKRERGIAGKSRA
jgi:cation diffusion facilitator family transporter